MPGGGEKLKISFSSSLPSLIRKKKSIFPERKVFILEEKFFDIQKKKNLSDEKSDQKKRKENYFDPPRLKMSIKILCISTQKIFIIIMIT